MTRAEQRVIENIVDTRPRIYGWQESIEREQERVVAGDGPGRRNGCLQCMVLGNIA